MKDANPLVSVIVPIYNVEKYIQKCVDSIIGQTYSNLEIILVDDGSPDNCPAICDEYQRKDHRVKVIHKPNGGLSDARNAGLDAATGKYVTFIDSDDWFEKDTIQILMHDAETDRIVSVDALSISDEMESSVERGTGEKRKLSAYDFLKGMNEQKYLCSSWGKIFPGELIKEFRFEVGRLNEDYLFLSTLLICMPIPMVLIDYKGYNYFVRQGSISRSGLGKSSVDAVYNTMKMLSLASDKAPNLVPCIGAYAAFQARSALLLMNFEEYRNDREFVKYCLKTIRVNRKYLPDSFMKKKDVLFCNLCMIAPAITVQMAKKHYSLCRKYHNR